MRALAFCLALLIAPPAVAQDEVLQPIEPQAAMAPNMIAQAQAAAQRGDAAEALSRYLRVLSGEPDNVAALTGAGGAALAVGDVNAAVGFYARAEDHAPRDGTIKAGLAAAMTQLGRAREALRFFSDAVSAGVAPATIAADRGLAYDLVGQPKRAQLEYAVALRTRASAEVTRRLALSQAIGGDRAGAIATLDPLLRKQDVAAWRTRAFVYAISGDIALASEDARAVLPSDQAAALAPYLARLATLKPAEKAAAVYLGRFPSETQTAARPPAPVRTATRPNLPVDGSVLAGAGGEASAFAGFSLQPTNRAQFAYVNPNAPRAAELTPPPRPEPALSPVIQPARADPVKQVRADREATRAKAAAAAKDKEERAAAAIAKRNPSRQWVQIAGGANKRDLPKEWTKLKARWPSQLGSRSPWTTHYRFTNRLLIGPFTSGDAAQDWVTARRGEGFTTFRVETAAGALVERVAAN